MGHPPPRNPHPTTSTEDASTAGTESEPESKTSAVDRFHRKSPQQQQLHNPPWPTTLPLTLFPTTRKLLQSKRKQNQRILPYTITEWSGPPCHKFSLEILKDGLHYRPIRIVSKGLTCLGRVELLAISFSSSLPISRFHAVLQFKRNGDAYLYDLGSTHGTFVNKQVEKGVYVALHVGEVIRFGLDASIVLMYHVLLEADRKSLRNAKIRQEMQASGKPRFNEARLEASLDDGISWGMGDDCDEVTWQNLHRTAYRERRSKPRDKVIKRTEKIAPMKKEIDAIRAKDIATRWINTRYWKNWKTWEETLNESIRESIGARFWKDISRLRKRNSRRLMRIFHETAVENGAGDALDTYMSGLLTHQEMLARERDSKVQIMKPDKAEVPVSATKANHPQNQRKVVHRETGPMSP
ncbi:LOW QUALITY PROTEIN: hypothetical protein NC653_012440 [Populus alba x Populus x berolinensis]|uniref:FHA domain-containing protein n=1 Tax=Populus alba x Populus x berolinensis TaxID=444605 RepID=A0AAD6R654_9ROSI|nr:LOW QUALITY PROTEIN: hypothetical protein NC653_012440 [Populus alba x Populus x berolinensis]